MYPSHSCHVPLSVVLLYTPLTPPTFGFVHILIIDPSLVTSRCVGKPLHPPPSTAQALALDSGRDQAQGQGPNEEKEDQDDSKLLSTLLFGWNSVFSLSNSNSNSGSNGGSGSNGSGGSGDGNNLFEDSPEEIDAGLQGMTNEQLDALIDRTR